jgi:hypothetical protein
VPLLSTVLLFAGCFDSHPKEWVGDYGYYDTEFPIPLSLKADGSATYKSNGHYFNGNFNGIWSYSDNSVTFNFRDQEYIFKSRGRALYDTTNREILKPLSQSPPPSGDGTIELEGGGNFSRYAFIHAIAGV